MFSNVKYFPHLLFTKTRVQPAFFRMGVFIICVLALFLRLIHIHYLDYSIDSDALEYWSVSPLFYQYNPNSKEFLKLTTMSPPGYYWFVGGIRILFRLSNFYPILVAQALFDTISVALIARLGRVLYNARAGILAALFYSIYRVAILCTGVILTECLAQFMCICVLFAFIVFRNRAGLFTCLLYSIVSCAAIHVRNNLLTFVLAFPIYHIISSALPFCPRRLGRSIGYATLMVIFCIAGCIPWSVRSSLLIGHPVIFTRNSSVLLIRNFNPWSGGKTGGFDALPPSIKKIYEDGDVLDFSPKLEAQRLAKAKEFISQSHPIYTLFSLIPYKLSFLSFYGNHLFIPWYIHSGGIEQFSLGPYLRIPLINYWPWAVIGFVGFLIRGRRCPYVILWAWLFFIGPLVITSALSPRYRYPSDFLLILAGAAAIDRILFTVNFTRRFLLAMYIYWGVAAVRSSVAIVLLSGANLTKETLFTKNAPIIFEASKTINFDRPNTEVKLGEIPVNPGLSPEMLARYTVHIQGNQHLKTTIRYNSDLTSTPLYETSFQNGELAWFQKGDRRHWRLLFPPAAANKAIIYATVFGSTQTIATRISDLDIRGAPWWKP